MLVLYWHQVHSKEHLEGFKALRMVVLYELYGFVSIKALENTL